MDLSADAILDHSRNPRNVLPLPTGKGRGEGYVHHQEKNPACGDEITLSLQIENDRITAVSWSGTGCAISQAAMSMLSEELVGKSLEEVEALPPQRVLDLLGVPVSLRRMKCALLGLHTLGNTIRTAKKETLQGWYELLEKAGL